MTRFLAMVGVGLMVGSLTGSAATYKTKETITVANTAIGLASATTDPSGWPQMKHCTGRVETAEIRIWWDGTAPTSTVGIPIEPLELITLDDYSDISQLKMIRTTATSATVTFVCWAN